VKMQRSDKKGKEEEKTQRKSGPKKKQKEKSASRLHEKTEESRALGHFSFPQLFFVFDLRIFCFDHMFLPTRMAEAAIVPSDAAPVVFHEENMLLGWKSKSPTKQKIKLRNKLFFFFFF